MNNNFYTKIRIRYEERICPNGFEDIINKLASEHIFGLDIIKDKLCILELCDEWYGVELTKQDCIELSNMFKFISENI